MKIDPRCHSFLITLVIFLSSCASNGDKLFSDSDESVPAKLERPIELPEQIKEKFELEKAGTPGPVQESSPKPKPQASPAKKIGESKKMAPQVATPVAPAAPATPELSEEELKKRANFKSWDIESKRVWDKFSPVVSVGEEMIYEISFLGVLAGHVKLLTKKPTKVANKDVYRFYAQLKSGRWYDFIYKLDDYLETFVDQDSFRPLKYSLIQRETKQNVDDLQLFDFDKGETYLDYYREKDGVKKKENKVEPIPFYFQDSYSALPFMRGVNMKVGDKHQFPIVTRGKIWLLRYEVIGEEEVKVQGKWIQALKVKAETKFPGVLEKRGDILFWFDTTELRRPVKFQAKVKIGSIEGLLIDYKAGTLLKEKE